MASFPSTRFLRDGRELPDELEEARVGIEALARSYGLDFFDTIFQMCTYEEINMVAAYGGFPTRYPHWRFGMEYLQLQKSYTFGLSKIYEMVINTDPSYAYLMDCNLAVDQKLVMAHVYGHVDFFKNNLWFAHTNRKMLDQMANHASTVRRIQERHGETEVERFIDLVLSIDNLIDPHAPHIQRVSAPPDAAAQERERNAEVPRLRSEHRYMDRFINPPEYMASQKKRKDDEQIRQLQSPLEPTRDVLGFLLARAPLEPWQQTILGLLRDEAYYFAPQGQTKIMNEGWASFWHTRLMTRHILSDAEVIDFADHNAGTMAMQPGQLNPYKIGVELWRHIEERWNKGRFGTGWMDEDDPRARADWDTEAGLGNEKIFQVRRTHNDVSFIDEFLTQDFCEAQGFFTTTFDERSGRWVIDSTEFGAIKQQLLEMLATRGTPRVYVSDDNALNRGELLLTHEHEGLDLQLDWAEQVLGNLAKLWRRPVHLDTRVEGKPTTLVHDGSRITRSTMKKKEAG